MKKINEKFINYFKDNIDLNPQRYQKAIKTYKDLKKDLLAVDRYSKVSLQGSFALKTAIKPKKNADDEYDIDVIVKIKEKINPDDTNSIKSVFTKLEEDINNIVEKNNHDGGNSKVTSISKGVKISFQKEFHVDIIPVFEREDKTGEVEKDTYIFDCKNNTPKFDSPFELTNHLMNQIDLNKMYLAKLVKHFVNSDYGVVKNLQLIPSIGMAITLIDDLSIQRTFDLEEVTKNIDFIIKMKYSDLINPFNISETFANQSIMKNVLIALDTIKLSLERAIKEDNFTIIKNMIEIGEFPEISNGISDQGGTGGHA